LEIFISTQQSIESWQNDKTRFLELSNFSLWKFLKWNFSVLKSLKFLSIMLKKWIKCAQNLFDFIFNRLLPLFLDGLKFFTIGGFFFVSAIFIFFSMKAFLNFHHVTRYLSMSNGLKRKIIQLFNISWTFWVSLSQFSFKNFHLREKINNFFLRVIT
jgi:hypothetical protein